MMKTVFLGNKKNKYEYTDINKLQEEAKRYWIAIGDNVTLGDGVGIWNNATIGSYSKIGIASTIKHSVTIGDCVSIGDGSTICHNSDIADDANIGNGIEILPRAKIKSGWTIKDIVHLKNEYAYYVSGYTINGIIIIQLGCFTRTIEEWENDFWNNKYFKEGSIGGQNRLKAFNKMKEIMEQILVSKNKHKGLK